MRVMTVMWACVLVIAAAAEVADERPRRHRGWAGRGCSYAEQMVSEISIDPRPRVCMLNRAHAFVQ